MTAPLREYFVAPWGDDVAGDGSRGRPFRTWGRVLDAVLNLEPGDEVTVGPFPPEG